MKKAAWLLAIAFYAIQNVFGGIEPEIKSYITGAPLAVVSPQPNIVTYDAVFYNSAGTRNGTSTSIYSGMPSVRNMTWLEINQAALNDCVAGSFSFSADLKIECKDKNGSALTTQYVTLSVNYDKALGIQYTDKHTRAYYGGYFCKVTVLSISNSAVVDYIQLNNSMLIERYKALNTATIPTLNTATVDATNGFIEVGWNTATGAEEYDLEWVFIDDYNNPAENFGGAGTPPAARDAADIDWTFRNNATRVTIKDNAYKITYLNEHGYLLVRVRGIGRTGALFTHRVEGAWSSDAYGPKIGTSFNLGEDAFHFVYETAESALLSGTGVVKVHESTLNWQYIATFAEEGKKKEVIGYSDGSMRNRQSVTKINSDNMAVAGETVYDYQGRQAGSFMPVPTFENRLKFYPNFNLSAWSGKNYSAKDFDSTTNYCPTRHIATLDEDAGAGLYYSANNPLSGDMHYEYLPDAQGYAFSLTEYMPDGTGRVRRQSGVGPDHKLGSGHETKYYYGTPDQIELDRLFGTAVGYSQHYQKNMVIDPNGQVSVSYLDLQGRVIATALAGSAPTNVQSLTGIGSASTLSVNINVDAKSDIYENRIESAKEILVTIEDDHVFDYSISVPRLTEDSKPSLCFDCVYTLEIKLFNECGENVLDGNPNTGGVQLLTRTVGRPIGAGTWDVSCSTVVYSFTLDGGVNNAPISVSLPVGSYTLVKTLSINEDAYAFYEAEYLDNNDSIKSKQDFKNEFIAEADFGQCETNCDSCFEKLGSLADFLQDGLDRLTGAGLTPNADDSAAINGTYASMLEFCQGLCEPVEKTCDAMLEIILADVSPGGQYAPLDIVAGARTYGGILSDDPDAINDLGFSYYGHWINSGDVYDFINMDYKDDDGNNIKVMIDDALEDPNTLTAEQYVTHFKPVWANTLAPFHPEYCKYKQCLEDRGAEQYEQNMLKVTSFQQAKDSGFLNPLNDAGAPFSAGRNDPYFETGGNGIADKSTLTTLIGAYKRLDMSNPDCSTLSVWDLAKVTYLCNYTECEDVEQCIADNTWATLTCEPVLDNIWMMFRSVYLAERRKIMDDNIPSGCPRTLALNGHIERFPKIDDVKSQVISSETSILTECNNSKTQFMLECDTNCIANAEVWMAGLKNCGWDVGDSTAFMMQLIGVCRNACDGDHPYGASSYPSGRTPRVSPAKPSYTSFRAVFEDYVNTGKITFSAGACDINSIAYPMDYDHNYTRFVDNNGKPCTKPGYATDPCTQETGNATLKDLYGRQHQIQIPDSVKCEKCITCKQLHTALSAVETHYAGTINDQDYDVKKAVVNALNMELDFNLSWQDYYDFMVQCGEFNASDSNILSQFQDLFAQQDNGLFQYREQPIKLRSLEQYIPYEKRPQFLVASTEDISYLSVITGDSVTITSCMCNKLQDPDPAVTNVMTPGTLANCLMMNGLDFYTLKNFCSQFYARMHPSPAPALDKNTGWAPKDKEKLKTLALVKKIYIPVSCLDPDTDCPTEKPANETNPFYSKETPPKPTEGYGSGGGGSPTTDSALVTSCDSMKMFLHRMDSICVASFTCTPSFKEMIKMHLFKKNSSALSSNPGLLSFVNAQYELMFPHLKKETRFGTDPYKKFLALLSLYNECIRESYQIINAACCKEPNKYARALMSTINKMAGTFDPFFGNIITLDNQKLYPSIPQYYNSALYNGLYKPTVQYTADPYGMPDIKMNFSDSLTHNRKVILTYTNNLMNEAEWSFITRVKDFRLLTLDYSCDSTNIFEFTAVQLTSRGEEEVTISGYFPGLNLGDSCDPNPSMKLCDKNYWDSPIEADTSDCYDRIEGWASYMSERAYEQYIALQKKGFRERYLAKCLGAFTGESFTMVKPDHEYHHTLYYYDQADNLIQTIPPAGVSKITNSTTLANIITNRNSDGTAVLASHTLPTQYEFNSLNQLIIQESPDAGQRRYWYDRIGRMAISQNAKQFGTSPKSYSYILFDVSGRINEIGELKCSTAMTVSIAFNPSNLATYINSQAKTEVTRSIYDVPSGAYPSTTYFVQENIRRRISSIQYFESLPSGAGASGTYTQAVHYTYDIHGNINVLLREIPALADIDQEYKSTIYKYDLVSGNVNRLIYQYGQADMFAHKYVYDADNRLIESYTSPNLMHWDRESKNAYYLHGPKSRSEIGELSVQGIDYAYTLHGWIKGVNNTTLRTNRDIGMDGEDASANELVAKDVFGYSLGYYEGEYKPIGLSRSSSPLTTSRLFTPLTTTSSLGRASKDLYNGNIRHMVTAIEPFMASTNKPQARAYQYDQLNRIKEAYTYDQVELDSNLWKYTGSANSDYEEHFTYDANGNINTLSRNGTAVGGTPLYMDNFTYNYTSGTNKLAYVDDSRTSSNYSDDIDDQSSGNYTYDAIGNMVSDAQEQISTISWTAYGKIKSINRTGGSTKPALLYEYTPDGHRVSKKVTETNGNITFTYYIRDAQGNTMSTYTRYTQTDSDDTFTWKEAHIYGSSRLGVYNADKILVRNGTNTTNPLASNEYKNIRGKRNYELTNHLGNVLAVITDRRTAICSSSLVIGYQAEVIDATDYYAFGSPMPGRQGIQRCTTVSVLDTATINVYSETFSSASTGSFTPAIGAIIVTNIFPGQLKIESSWTARPSASSPIFRVAPSKTYKLSINLADISVGTGKTHTVRVRINYPGGNVTNSYTTTGVKTFTFTTSSGGNATIDVFSQILPSTGGYGPGNPYVTIDDILISYDSSFYANMTTCVLDKNGYRYGFNGMEKDKEHNVDGGSYDFGARIYDSRLGRWLSMDPMYNIYSFCSPYNFCLNNPISFVDPDGNFVKVVNDYSANVLLQTLNEIYGTGIFSITTANFIEVNVKAYKKAKKTWSKEKRDLAKKFISLVNSGEYTHYFAAFPNLTTSQSITLKEVGTDVIYDHINYGNKPITLLSNYSSELTQFTKLAHTIAGKIFAGEDNSGFDNTTVVGIVVDQVKAPLSSEDAEKEGITNFNLSATIMHEFLDHSYTYQKSKNKRLLNKPNTSGFQRVKHYNLTAKVLGAPTRTGETHDTGISVKTKNKPTSSPSSQPVNDEDKDF